MNETRKSTFLTANVMFMILAFTFIIGSFVMAYLKTNFRLSIVIIQYVIIFLPILIVMKVKGVDIKKQLVELACLARLVHGNLLYVLALC